MYQIASYSEHIFTWWHLPVIPALGRWTQGGRGRQKAKVILNYKLHPSIRVCLRDEQTDKPPSRINNKVEI